jgi:hypothetical protein
MNDMTASITLLQHEKYISCNLKRTATNYHVLNHVVHLMDFTELYKHSSTLVEASPSPHEFLLISFEDRLLVRRTDTLQIVRAWLVDSSQVGSTLSDAAGSRRLLSQTASKDGYITHIGWSYDCRYVLASCSRKGFTTVFCMEDDKFKAKILSGVEGLVKAEWLPDGRSILCFSEWGVSMWPEWRTNPSAEWFDLTSSESLYGHLSLAFQRIFNFPSFLAEVRSPC